MHTLVLAGKFVIIHLIGQVDLAEQLIPGQDRHAQEGMHLRVIGWKTDAARVCADLWDADRAALLAHDAQQPPADRRVGHALDLFFGHPNRDELLQIPLVIHHAQGSIARSGLFARQSAQCVPAQFPGIDR